MIKKIKVVLATLLAAAALSTPAFATDYVVNSTADNTSSDGAITLREALNATTYNSAFGDAPAGGANDTVSFDAGVFNTQKTISLGGTMLDTGGTVVITGPAVGVIINAGNASQGMRINNGNATISNLTFTGANGNLGGGLGNYGTTTLNNCTFTGNNSGAGAGIINAGNLTLNYCTVSNNTATSAGGGISNYNSGAVLAVNNSTISGNSAIYGGGIMSNPGTTLTLKNSTISGNTALGGGGIRVDQTPTTIDSCTFAGNKETGGGGGAIVSSNNSVTLRNSIFKAGQGANFITGSGGITSNGYNLSSDNGGGFLTGTGDIISTEPNLGTLTNNGGPTSTHALQTGSPAIDAGNTTLTTDQRNRVRPFGTADDIGAVESGSTVEVQFGPNFIVNKTADTNDGSCTSDDCSLREAITAANSNADASAITFDATFFNTAKTITIGSALPDLSTPVTITGSQAGVTVAGQFPVFNLFTVNSGTTATFTDLTINNGSTGIFNSGTANVNNSTITNSGRGIDNNTGGAIVNVTNSTFNGNDTHAIYNASTANVTNSTFIGNGFGITNNGTATLKNTIVTGNTNGNTPGVFVISADNFVGGDAKLGALQDNGGPTFTMLPEAASPVIDAGTATGAPTKDQRGVLRPQGAGIDIGAVEVAVNAPAGPNFVVTVVEDADDGNYLANDISLREAIKFANNNADASDITFNIPGDGPHTIQLASALPDLSTSIDFIGPTTEKISIRGEGASEEYSVFKILAGKTVGLTNLSITNGKASHGGGVFSSGILNVTASTFNGNTANAHGGGIYNNGGTLTITNSTLSDNTATTFGGAVISNGGTVTIKDSTLTNNNANNGGGISKVGGALSVSNSIVAGNTAATNANISGTYTGSNNVIDTDAKLGALRDNGGPTFTHVPAPDSPAVDNGATDEGTDQRGVLRPQGAADDIGAVELAVTDGPDFVVTVTEDTDDGNYAANDISLREAINFANANSDDSAITFDPTVFAEKQTITADNIYYLNTK